MSDSNETLFPPSEEGIHRTFRSSHPIVEVLEADDHGDSFLAYMRSLLVPGEWETPTSNGFEWFAYRLPHSVEITQLDGNNGPRLICRSTFLIAEGLGELEGPTAANYLNQRPFGAGVFCNITNGNLVAVSSVELNPASWWNAFLFGNSVMRQVGIWENLAPRIIDEFGGQLPTRAHPVHGPRPDPDQFLFETLRMPMEPEAATGLWFSSNEITRYRNKNKDLLEMSGLTEQSSRILPYEFDESNTSADELTQWITIPMGAHKMTFRLRQSDHPDLGRGLEIFGVTNVRVNGGVSDTTMPANAGYLGCLATSLLNVYQLDECPAPLNLGGWTSWRGQLAWTSFIDGESFRQLLSIGNQGAGVILSLLLSDQTLTNSALAWLMTESFLAQDAETWVHTDEIEWDGVEQNAGLIPLIVPNGIIDRLGPDDVPVNQMIEPIVIDGPDAWYQHSLLLATWGIFNPAGPSVGSLEIAVDFASQKALLLERLRHPFAARVLVHAILDREGFDNRADFVTEIIANLNWSLPDWLEVVDYDPAVEDSVRVGLRRFAELQDEDFRHTTQLLIASLNNPWARLTNPDLDLPDVEGDPIEGWIDAITHPANIDSHVAYLRSAWEGAVLFRVGETEKAQEMSNRLIREVAQRTSQV